MCRGRTWRWDDWRVEDVELFDGAGDRVAGIFRLVGTGKASRAVVGQQIGLAYRFREGRLWRMRAVAVTEARRDLAELLELTDPQVE